MVRAPASRPSPARRLRQATISSSSTAEVRLAGTLGPRRTGARAASPPARNRATWRCTQDLERPVAFATARTERPTSSTASTQYLARSMGPPHNGCPRIADTSCPRNCGTSDHRLHSCDVSDFLGRLVNGLWTGLAAGVVELTRIHRQRASSAGAYSRLGDEN